MADTNDHINENSDSESESEGSEESTDLAAAAAAISLSALNLEVADSADMTAVISLFQLNSNTQVHQETSLPIKKRPSQNNIALDGGPLIVHVNYRTQTYVPRSASRKLAPEACCFIRELSEIDADHDLGRLYLTRDEAETIPSCPHMTEVPKGTRKIAKLMVFDYRDVLWNMMLNCYKSCDQGNILYLLSIDDWRNFLRAHELERGDTIFFYKNIDSRINGDDYYYIILFWRLKDGGFNTFLNLPCKKITS